MHSVINGNHIQFAKSNSCIFCTYFSYGKVSKFSINFCHTVLHILTRFYWNILSSDFTEFLLCHRSDL